MLIEIHMDEVAIHLTHPVKHPGNTLEVPVWEGKALGNDKYQVWGERMELIEMPSQKTLGYGFIMQNPPHCDDVESQS